MCLQHDVWARVWIRVRAHGVTTDVWRQKVAQRWTRAGNSNRGCQRILRKNPTPEILILGKKSASRECRDHRLFSCNIFGTWNSRFIGEIACPMDINWKFGFLRILVFFFPSASKEFRFFSLFKISNGRKLSIWLFLINKLIVLNNLFWIMVNNILDDEVISTLLYCKGK